jgi:hypothetical protein
LYCYTSKARKQSTDVIAHVFEMLCFLLHLLCEAEADARQNSYF